MLTYDRFGQGQTTAHDPLDDLPSKQPGYGHDMLDVTKDLRELLQAVGLRTTAEPRNRIFVAASIGAHIARLYVQSNPGEVNGILVLDSNIGNAEFTDFWPNPQAPDFDPKDVTTDDCSLEQYLDAYAKLGKMFDSSVKNAEGLDRRNVKNLLPDPGARKLIGPDEEGLWLTVADHEPEAFANESHERIKIPKSLTGRYTDPLVAVLKIGRRSH